MSNEAKFPLEECSLCSRARQLVASLQQCLHPNSGVNLCGTPCNETNHHLSADPKCITTLRVLCRRCKGTGYVLNETGRQAVQLLQQQGYLKDVDLTEPLTVPNAPREELPVIIDGCPF